MTNYKEKFAELLRRALPILERQSHNDGAVYHLWTQISVALNDYGVSVWKDATRLDSPTKQPLYIEKLYQIKPSHKDASTGWLTVDEKQYRGLVKSGRWVGRMLYVSSIEYSTRLSIQE